MIQFNLLPDIKLEYIRARRTKRTVMVTASAISLITLVFFVILASNVYIFQKKHISNLTEDIAASSKDLTGTEDLNKILTIQNQLNSLGTLHDQKPQTTRLLKFVQQFTPANIRISSLNVDFEAYTMTVSGNADSIPAVNSYVDTLKFTDFTDGNSTSKAFSEVVLTSFAPKDKETSYSIGFKFNEALFDNTKEITLNIPQNTVTTRSSQEKPKLFETPTQTNGGTQ